MSAARYRIRGTVSDAAAPDAGAGVAVLHGRRLIPGRARDGVTGELEVAADEVVRIELDNGFVLWSRADDLVREHGHRSVSRDGDSAWEFDALDTAATAPASRGLLGLGIRVLDFFGIDLKKKSAAALGKWFEEKRLARPPGFYHCTLDAFALTPLAARAAIAADAGPLLVFLHGTGSSCEGSFGGLWDAANREGAALRRRLTARYGERVFALEHRSLTESPISNALALAKRLPKGAELHL
ncbi:DUF7379 domain-containing protein, partial [Methyloversatilis discipulorum]|uniref:DUF7379 domain-containing protein n=1 Tax=Methyloversatilis discipulorum TaxID=1119528 RepID=UPI003AF5DBA5